MTGSASMVIGLTAVIVAVTDEVPRVLVVRRMTHALATPEQRGQEVLDPTAAAAEALPFGPFSPSRHRTLESGLRSWVEEQTGLPLRYVEQLYTFGDRFRDPRELVGGPRVVSVGYIALVRQAPLSGTGEAEWRDWYEFCPWEDWRTCRPPVINPIIRPALRHWIDDAPDPEARRLRQDRVSTAFGLDDDATWDFDRALERYELLYEVGLVAEALRDRQILASLDSGAPPPRPTAEQERIARALGAPMALDNRRILAVALGRLRGKLKYRPLVFDLLPPAFTLYKLQRLVEALSGVRLHKQNFRRLVISGGMVEPTGTIDSHTGGRPAELYRFRRDVLRERLSSGVGLPAIRVSD